MPWDGMRNLVHEGWWEQGGESCPPWKESQMDQYQQIERLLEKIAELQALIKQLEEALKSQ